MVTKRKLKSVDMLYSSEDQLEGARAFAEKRKPRVEGQVSPQSPPKENGRVRWRTAAISVWRGVRPPDVEADPEISCRQSASDRAT